MRGPAAVAVALAVALLAGAVLGPAAASSPPRPVCPACGTLFERTAADHGVDVTVHESTALVQVHGNGSATWTICNRLNATDGFREDPDALDATARGLADREYGPPRDATLRAARPQGDTAVVVLHDPDAAERHAGLLVVDYLHTGGDGTGIRLNADRFSIRGPSGTVVTNTPASGSVNGSTVTWTGSVAGPGYVGPSLDGSPYVAFGAPSDRGLRTAAALALATLPIVVGALGRFVLGQTLLFAGTLAVVAAAAHGHEFERGPVAYGSVLAAVGAAGALLPGLANGPGWVSVPALAAVGIGLAATHPAVRGRQWTPGRLAAGAGVVLVLASAVLFALEHAIDAYDPFRATARSLGLALPFAACLPLGAALRGSRREILVWGGVAVLAFVVTTLTLVNPADPPTGLGGGLLLVFLYGFAVAFPVLGSLVLATGWALVSREPGSPWTA
ncbi:hypothetical protein [Haloglomus halophilum]|uniref:hypothetical protein n=1 Tax=Haloglomus halophilum TaxID=2962672 RepID=UPI0020CA20BB|nr:hypothetical protein [Haloglomus halophilum]